MAYYCQHCEKAIRRHPSGAWFDNEGSVYCMRLPYGEALPHRPALI